MQLLVDPQRNVLRLQLEPEVGSKRHQSHSGVIEVGEGGQLVGVFVSHIEPHRFGQWAAYGVVIEEDDGVYIEFSEPSPIGRSAAIDVQVTLIDEAVISLEWPRRGVGYEITAPSGNR